MPGMAKFLAWASPSTHGADLKSKPVFLFSAKDDSTVPTGTVQSFADALKKAGTEVEFMTVESGEHYDSMIGKGIPAGINWIKRVDAKRQAGKK